MLGMADDDVTDRQEDSPSWQVCDCQNVMTSFHWTTKSEA